MYSLGRTFFALAVIALSLASCVGDEGYYAPTAHAKCRERGLTPDSAAYKRCVADLERAEYAKTLRYIGSD